MGEKQYPYSVERGRNASVFEGDGTNGDGNGSEREKAQWTMDERAEGGLGRGRSGKDQKIKIKIKKFKTPHQSSSQFGQGQCSPRYPPPGRASNTMGGK